VTSDDVRALRARLSAVIELPPPASTCTAADRAASQALRLLNAACGRRSWSIENGADGFIVTIYGDDMDGFAGEHPCLETSTLQAIALWQGLPLD
jgi:hypothetical protein